MIKMNRLICHPTRHLTRPHNQLTSLHSTISIAPTASLVSLASPPSPQSPPLHRHSRSLFSSAICHRNTTNPTICTNNHGLFGMPLLPATRRNYSTTQQLLLRNQQKQPKLAHEWIIDGQVHSGDDIISSDVAQEKEVVLFLHGLLGNAKVRSVYHILLSANVCLRMLCVLEIPLLLFRNVMHAHVVGMIPVLFSSCLNLIYFLNENKQSNSCISFEFLSFFNYFMQTNLEHWMISNAII